MSWETPRWISRERHGLVRRKSHHTSDSVFQIVEGGLGYWAGNHFHYGPPKFSMNGTQQSYDYEVGSVVTYSWFRFVDQSSFQKYNWSAEQKAKRQDFVEKLHKNYPIDHDYMAPPARGKLVALDPALLVKPPEGAALMI